MPAAICHSQPGNFAGCSSLSFEFVGRQVAAFGIGENGLADTIEMYLKDIFTVTENMAGRLGIAVRAGKDTQTLPLGPQLIKPANLL